MTIQEQFAAYVLEVQALRHFYNIEVSNTVWQALHAFDVAIKSPEHVDSDTFSRLLHDIDATIEDVCLERNIQQEVLEVLIEGNEAFLSDYRVF